MDLGSVLIEPSGALCGVDTALDRVAMGTVEVVWVPVAA